MVEPEAATKIETQPTATEAIAETHPLEHQPVQQEETAVGHAEAPADPQP